MKSSIRLLGVGIFLLIASLIAVIEMRSHNSIQSSDCDYYVDNMAADGDGSWNSPWRDVPSHVANLSPGDVMCIRGDTSGAGRVYLTETITLTRNGTVSQPNIIRPYPGEKVILRNNADDSLLVFVGADYWIIDGLILDNDAKPRSAVNFKSGASHNLLRDNEIYNGRANGVDISRGSTDNVLENNHIHHFNASGADAHCIVLSAETDRTLIRQNTIHDCSGDGIQIIQPDNLTLPDFPDNVQIIENVFYRGALPRAENAIDIKAATNLLVRGNRMYGYVDNSAVILQKASLNVLFENNVIYDSRRAFNIHAEEEGQPEGVTIRNNIIYDITEYAIHVNGVKDGTLVHNTIVNTQENAIIVAGSGLIDGLIQNNLIVNSGRTRLKDDVVFNNVTVGQNAWFDSEADSAFTSPTDFIGTGDPGFVNAAGRDYHLKTDSPAREAGADAGM